MLRKILFGASVALLAAGGAEAMRIYPIDRAVFPAGSKFDFKVELDNVVKPDDVKITIDGRAPNETLGGQVVFVEKEAGVGASAFLLRDAAILSPGPHTVTVNDGRTTQSVTWEVYGTPGPRKARNVILFIGDGFSVAHRTAARILSKGIKEGKYKGKLAMDDMPHMALVGTSGVDSILTDSANAMSAYTTGHKSSVNALGVYADRTPDTLDDPKVETTASLEKRKLEMAVGVVTNTEVEDATPAGMVTHTRRRSDHDVIVDQYYRSGVEVLMGGGAANFLPKSTPGSRRKDEEDYVSQFRQAGYALATTDGEMKQAAAESGTTKLLGLFHPSNVDVALDRKFLKKGTVDKFPNQPDLPDMVRAALAVLSRNPNGFVLMVESGLIDKQSHTLDWERAVMDAILLDKAVEVAKELSARRGDDTLILLTADHSYGLAIVGIVDDGVKAEQMRDKVGVYEKAGYPNYPEPNAGGYTEDLAVSKRLAVFFAAFPDYYETFRPKLDGPFVPAVHGPEKLSTANEKYEDAPGAVLRTGVLPREAPQGVHSGEDVVLTAAGPGSERVSGFMENTEVFGVIVEALALAK